MRKHVIAGLLAALSLASLPAVAADNGFYLGASVGQSGVEVDEVVDGFDLDYDASTTAYKIIAGWRPPRITQAGASTRARAGDVRASVPSRAANRSEGCNTELADRVMGDAGSAGAASKGSCAATVNVAITRRASRAVADSGDSGNAEPDAERMTDGSAGTSCKVAKAEPSVARRTVSRASA